MRRSEGLDTLYKPTPSYKISGTHMTTTSKQFSN